ncbi:tyrosine-protein phosphatase non-receptor type 9-like [Cydia pomonella]|uniref:tyrosine-protein phosphatase non-receptor type 9-like n=1 Tax=Cydia pomonella TaxID=82600 RepID=UPI002ADE4055|nr:tyrosine-protein phosphatase non-receptor type 9-like [Cydia pomonella]
MSNPKSKSLTFGDFISDVDKPYFIDRLLEEHKQVLETGVPLTRGTYTYAGPEKRPVFKHSRVELSGEDSTIINASYIRGFERPKAYIATETPQSAKGAQAFWETVWQHRTKVIVMLNKPEKEERGYCYWGPGAGLSLQFGKLKVSTVEIEALLPTLEITKLEVSNEKGDSLTVYHFLYFKWPVHCELPPTYDFLRFLFTLSTQHQCDKTNLSSNETKKAACEKDSLVLHTIALVTSAANPRFSSLRGVAAHHEHQRVDKQAQREQEYQHRNGHQHLHKQLLSS